MKVLIQNRCQVHKYPVEVLLHNIVDKDLQSILLPLDLMQTILCCPKYIIRDNFIVPLNRLYRILFFFITMLYVLTTWVKFVVLDPFRDPVAKKYPNVAIFMMCFNVTFGSSGFIMNYVISVNKSANYVKFVLILQRVHQFLKGEDSRRFVNGNWQYIFLMLVPYVGVSVWLVSREVPFFVLLSVITSLSFDMNMVYTIRLILFLKNKLCLWNYEAMALGNRCFIKEKEVCKKVFTAYADIFECCRIFTNVSQFMTVYYAVELFSYALIHMQSWFEIVKTFGYDPSLYLLAWSVYAWILKTWMWQTLLSVAFEKFYISVQKSQDTCALILGSNPSVGVKKVCKNAKRLHRATFNKSRPCGLFLVDATLPLQIFNLITNYIIVLFQFVFMEK